MTNNCYGCKFALGARNHVRYGEQVRCQKAEELFGTDVKGGERWVDVKRSEKTGKLLKAKCGEFQPFVGDTSEVTVTAPTLETQICETCKGTGEVIIRFTEKSKAMKCNKCNGMGEVSIDTH